MKIAQLSLRLNTAVALAAALLLSACGTIRNVDADVSSYAGQTAAVQGATYRFEQLPSQAKEPLREQIQAMAETALGAAGLKRDDPAARYTVEIGLVSEQYLRQPVLLLSRHSRLVLANDPLFWPPYMYGSSLNNPWYRYQLRLVMRDTSNAKIAYETNAELEVPWSDSINMIPALLSAALRDYPVPPSGSRKINVDLGDAKVTKN